MPLLIGNDDILGADVYMIAFLKALNPSSPIDQYIIELQLVIYLQLNKYFTYSWESEGSGIGL